MDNLYEAVGGVVDIGFGGGRIERKADGIVGSDGVAGDSLNNVGGLAEGAGGAGGDGYTLLVEHEEDGFAFGASEGDVEDIGEGVFGVAVSCGVWDFFCDAAAEMVS